MKVWLLQVGCYENTLIRGIFASPEGAMAAWSPTREKSFQPNRGSEYGPWAGKPWSFVWSGPDGDGCYHFGADWDDAASITPYEVEP